MSIFLEINSKTPRTLHIKKLHKIEGFDIKLYISELTLDEKVKIAAWALQDVLIK